MVKFREAIVEPGLKGEVVVLARTGEGSDTRVVAEIRRRPTKARPFRVQIHFVGRSRRADCYSASLASAVILVRQAKNIGNIVVRTGTTGEFYDGDLVS